MVVLLFFKLFKLIENHETDLFLLSGFFVLQTFTNDRTTGEGGGHFFDSSLPLPSASQTLRH